MGARPRVSVVLPTYDERENVQEVIERIERALGPSLHEILVVDDDSPDGTADFLATLARPRVRVIRRTTERGLASAIARGVREATGDVVAWLDCDLGIPPEDLPRLIARTSETDLVVGSRYVENGADTRPWLRALASALACRFSNAVLRLGVRDATSGFAAARRDALSRIEFPGTGFGDYFVELLLRCRRAGLSIAEVGYVFGPRLRGTSKLDGDLRTFLGHGLRYGLRILRLRIGACAPAPGGWRA